MAKRRFVTADTRYWRGEMRGKAGVQRRERGDYRLESVQHGERRIAALEN